MSGVRLCLSSVTLCILPLRQGLSVSQQTPGILLSPFPSALLLSRLTFHVNGGDLNSGLHAHRAISPAHSGVNCKAKFFESKVTSMPQFPIFEKSGR